MASVDDVQRFRGGLVCKAHRLCVSLNSRLESNIEETRNVEDAGTKPPPFGSVRMFSWPSGPSSSSLLLSSLELSDTQVYEP